MQNEYHNDTEHLTKTAFTVFVDSPREYYLQFITHEMPRKRATKPMGTGIVLHGMLLEKKRLEELVGIYPANCLKAGKRGDLNPKPAEAFRDANPDKVAFMKEKEAESIQIVYDNVKDSAISDAIHEASHFEKEFRSTVYGTKCKCKPDIAGDMGEYWTCWDLKFMERVDPTSWQRSARQFRYYLQDAHYSAVLRELHGKPVVFKFLAVEINFPYRVHCYWYEPREREIARDFHKKKIIELQACIRSGDWSDNWPNATPLNTWDVGGDGAAEVLDWEDAA